jgi:thymidylate synthase
MNDLDRQYKELLEHIIHFGVEKQDRTGTGTKSIFGWQIRHNMKNGFPLLTTKKMAWKSIVTELLWFLRGDTNIKYLVDNDCHIWDGDAYKRYERANTWELQDTPPMNEFIKRIKEDETFRKTWGELGPIYGRQWRDWNGIDQIKNLIEQLQSNPDSRRLMVNAWNVSDLELMTLPPCHYGFQVYTRELTGEERWKLLEKKVGIENFKLMVDDLVPFGGGLSEELQQYNTPIRAISLMWNQRSVDTFLGLPFNIASYGLLLEMIADEVNMIPDELIGNLGDTHLYLNHIEQAKEQITRIPFELPTLNIESEVKWKVGDCLPTYSIEHLTLENYQSHPAIKAPLSN